jgi:hypothetical protein
MAKKRNAEEKSAPVETLEERVARGIREGRFRAPKKESFDWEEWRKLSRPEIDPDVAESILKDLIGGRFR